MSVQAEIRKTIMASRTGPITFAHLIPLLIRAADRLDEQCSSIREMVALCAIGDCDEDTEAYGWGEAIKRAKALLL